MLVILISYKLLNGKERYHESATRVTGFDPRGYLDTTPAIG